jgi:hypothetical protein
MRQKFAFRDGREPVKRTATCVLGGGFQRAGHLRSVLGEETGVQIATGRILEHKIC